MAKLSTAARKKMPKKDFALPGQEAYPVEDKSHAKNAKARASQAVNAGRMSKGTEAKIDAKADKVIKPVIKPRKSSKKAAKKKM